MSNSIDLMIEDDIDDGDETLDLDYGFCRYIVRWIDQLGRVAYERVVVVPDGTNLNFVPNLDPGLYIVDGIEFNDVADSSVAPVVEKEIKVLFSARVVGLEEE